MILINRYYKSVKTKSIKHSVGTTLHALRIKFVIQYENKRNEKKTFIHEQHAILLNGIRPIGSGNSLFRIGKLASAVTCIQNIDVWLR